MVTLCTMIPLTITSGFGINNPPRVSVAIQPLFGDGTLGGVSGERAIEAEQTQRKRRAKESENTVFGSHITYQSIAAENHTGKSGVVTVAFSVEMPVALEVAIRASCVSWSL